jgi:hypothetical protein
MVRTTNVVTSQAKDILMRQRGPRSSASHLTVVVQESQPGRPPAPAYLDAEAASQWRQYVAAMPERWFPAETEPLLAELCVNTVLSRKLASELAGMRSLSRTKSFDKFIELLRLKIQLSEVVARASTKLRLTNQSRMSDRQAANASQRTSTKPWDMPVPTGPVDWER